MAIVAVLVGFFAIVFAFLAKNFYAADIWGGSVGDKPIPKWLGRTLFVSVGIFMIVVGTAIWINGSSPSKHSSSIHFSW